MRCATVGYFLETPAGQELSSHGNRAVHRLACSQLQPLTTRLAIVAGRFLLVADNSIFFQFGSRISRCQTEGLAISPNNDVSPSVPGSGNRLFGRVAARCRDFSVHGEQFAVETDHCFFSP